VFSPEFLTERNSIEDFKTCSRVIFGGNQPDTQACVDLFKIIYPDKTYRQTDHRTAEVVKYYINTFLACKISFANEVKQICDSIEVEYNDVKELALLDERIGKTHLNVPGHDGNCGFGGTCFPKDLNSFIHFAELNKIDPIVLKSVWSKNLEVRINKDWESMPGRAVSKGESNEQ
jgi:UDPglucose 6-dehydrogenase